MIGTYKNGGFGGQWQGIYSHIEPDLGLQVLNLFLAEAQQSMIRDLLGVFRSTET